MGALSCNREILSLSLAFVQNFAPKKKADLNKSFAFVNLQDRSLTIVVLV
jgi:hypothetical protein